MVNFREKNRVDEPPPLYTPPQTYLTVALNWGGEHRLEPIPHYVGGFMAKIDWVIARQMSMSSLLNTCHEVCGEWKGTREFFVHVGLSFKKLDSDGAVREWSIKHLPFKQIDIYIDDLDDHEGELGETEHDKDIRENKQDGGVYDSGNFEDELGDDELDVGEEITGEQDGENGRNREYEEIVREKKGKAVCENEESSGEDGDDLGSEFSDEFSEDSDYKMIEDSEADDDDRIYEEAVDDTERGVVDKGDSVLVSSDEDVIGGAAGDFDEGKHSDGEEGGDRFPVFNPDIALEPGNFAVGMVFADRIVFKKAVQSYTIKRKRQVQYTKNCPERVYARCRNPTCQWKINLLKVFGEESYQIRVFEPEHTCPPVYQVCNVKSAWLAEKFLHRFVADPKRKVETFRRDVSDDLGIDISRDQAFRARRIALKKLEGNPAAQYSKLWDYADEIIRTNPGSTVIVGSTNEGDNRFSNLYICLDAVKRGFREGCRRIIGVDGCHLKGPQLGHVLLAAVGVDANNNIYPLAWAVVGTESRETWEWFLICIKHDLNLGEGYEFTFMSDKQKGLILAFNEVFPDCEHRYCVRHLHENFKNAGYRGESYKRALWRAANAGTVPEWKERMLELKTISLEAWQWLNEKPASQWSKSHFTEQCMCDMLLNNVCESFNSSILEAREAPILTMCEWIKEWLMVRFQKNRDSSLKWKGKICPKIRKILERNIEISAECRPLKCDQVHCQVRCKDGTQYTVNLADHTCGCRIWDISGVPCKHAISAILHQRGNPEDFVNQWYSVERYQASYAHTIKGVNGLVLWKDTVFIPPLPPNVMRGKGRPASARRNQPDEKHLKRRKQTRGRVSNAMKRRQVIVSCRKCGEQGHNAITCGRESRTKSKKKASVGSSSIHHQTRKQQTMERIAREKEALERQNNPTDDPMESQPEQAPMEASNADMQESQPVQAPMEASNEDMQESQPVQAPMEASNEDMQESQPVQAPQNQKGQKKRLGKRRISARKAVSENVNHSASSLPPRQVFKQPNKVMTKKRTAARKLHLADEPTDDDEPGSVVAPQSNTVNPSQDSEIIDMTLPTQSSQAQGSPVKVPGPTMWEQLRTGSRKLGISTRGGPSVEGRKFMSLKDLHAMSRKKK